MNNQNLAKQIVAFQKFLFDASFGAITMIQDNTVNMTNRFLSHFEWLPEESKKNIDTWVELYKEARVNYKKAIDDSFTKLEEMGFTQFDELFKEVA